MKTLVVVLWLAWFQVTTVAALLFLRLVLWASGIPAEEGWRIAITFVALGAGVLTAAMLTTTDALEEQARALLEWRACRRHQQATPRQVDEQ
ncbi:hypothetical protein [Corallococcus carmarthensis]|uniref:Uncharacterized protein n=1 Tax=Corallococcus carmarthensis TaxID=2316728 RepID=A0A3A8KMK5_9BACT|nr:hypothetical protein [Corallococcus carmarthensis]RKH03662.1 hypothetical protein D7X32_13475 [Corallococcus carmarthensis]